MNKAIIDSIIWHRDQLFKSLEDDDLIKMEGSIQSVKSDLNEIIEKAKKRVWVKPTATKKGHYREQEVGVGDVKEKKKDSIRTALLNAGWDAPKIKKAMVEIDKTNKDYFVTDDGMKFSLK